MDILLILAMIIALLLIIIILILYNGLKAHLLIQKREAELNYSLVLSLIKIPLFKRNNTDKSKKDEEKEERKEGEKNEGEENPDDKGLKEKYEEIKPIIQELKESKQLLKKSVKKILRSIDFKKINGDLRIGLNDNMTTIKIASWIWSIGAIVNTASEPTRLTVEPLFTEEVIDFDVELELKINLLLILIVGIGLISKKEIRELIKTIRNYRKEHNSKTEIAND